MPHLFLSRKIEDGNAWTGEAGGGCVRVGKTAAWYAFAMGQVKSRRRGQEQQQQQQEEAGRGAAAGLQPPPRAPCHIHKLPAAILRLIYARIPPCHVSCGRGGLPASPAAATPSPAGGAGAGGAASGGGGASHRAVVRRPLRPFWRPFRLRFTYVASVLVTKY
jgi:hypothetical protein